MERAFDGSFWVILLKVTELPQGQQSCGGMWDHLFGLLRGYADVYVCMLVARMTTGKVYLSWTKEKRAKILTSHLPLHIQLTKTNSKRFLMGWQPQSYHWLTVGSLHEVSNHFLGIIDSTSLQRFHIGINILYFTLKRLYS